MQKNSYFKLVRSHNITKYIYEKKILENREKSDETSKDTCKYFKSNHFSNN